MSNIDRRTFFSVYEGSTEDSTVPVWQKELTRSVINTLLSMKWGDDQIETHLRSHTLPATANFHQLPDQVFLSTNQVDFPNITDQSEEILRNRIEYYPHIIDDLLTLKRLITQTTPYSEMQDHLNEFVERRATFWGSITNEQRSNQQFRDFQKDESLFMSSLHTVYRQSHSERSVFYQLQTQITNWLNHCYNSFTFEPAKGGVIIREEVPRYLVIKKIGDHNAYMCWDSLFHQYVFIKKTDYGQTITSSSEFFTQLLAQIAAQESVPATHHPLYTGPDDSGKYSTWLVTEHIADPNIEEQFAIIRSVKNPEIVRYTLINLTQQLAKVSEALIRYFLHNDLKPKNIAFSHQGNGVDGKSISALTIMDFGAASTANNGIWRSFPYFSVHQLEGKNDPVSSTVYALAAIIYEGVTNSTHMPLMELSRDKLKEIEHEFRSGKEKWEAALERLQFALLDLGISDKKMTACAQLFERAFGIHDRDIREPFLTVTDFCDKVVEILESSKKKSAISRIMSSVQRRLRVAQPANEPPTQKIIMQEETQNLTSE